GRRGESSTVVTGCSRRGTTRTPWLPWLNPSAPTPPNPLASERPGALGPRLGPGAAWPASTWTCMSRPFAAEPGRRWLAYQLRRPFVRDAAVLQVGAFATLGVNFLLSVALARLLGRDAYGAYALVISTMTTVSL